MQSVSSQIDRITVQLDKHKGNLTKDVELLDGLYDQNKKYFDDVTLYIAALSVRNSRFNQKRYQSRTKCNTLKIKWIFKPLLIWNNSDRLEKRIYDLQLSRQIAIQTAPQIRMIQNVNQALAEKSKAQFLQVFLYGRIKWQLL